MRTSVTDLVVFHMFSIMTEILKTELACVGSLRIICICYELDKQFIFFMQLHVCLGYYMCL